MKGTVPHLSPSFNPAVSSETRPEHLSAETGALVQREMMERSGIVGWPAERLHDPRNRDLIRYPLEEAAHGPASSFGEMPRTLPWPARRRRGIPNMP